MENCRQRGGGHSQFPACEERTKSAVLPAHAGGLSMRSHIGLVLALFLISIGSASANPTQWTPGSGGNGHFYDAILVPGGIDWFTARNAALASGGDLATITSAAEGNFVHALIAGTPAFWINVGDDTRGPWLGAI